MKSENEEKDVTDLCIELCIYLNESNYPNDVKLFIMKKLEVINKAYLKEYKEDRKELATAITDKFIEGLNSLIDDMRRLVEQLDKEV